MESRELEVRLAEPEDAEDIVALIGRCYAKTYPWSEGVDPIAIGSRIRDGSLTYAIVRNEDRTHVAQVALEPRGAHGLVDHGRAIVDPAYRGRGLFAAMDALL